MGEKGEREENEIGEVQSKTGKETATGAVKVGGHIKPHHAGYRCIHKRTLCCLSIVSKSGKQENMQT